MLKKFDKMLRKEKKVQVDSGEIQNKRIYIDWGRQGGIILGYVAIMLGFYGIIANTMMFNQYGNWISYVDMDRTILFWAYTTFISPNLEPLIFVLILIAITSLIIVFSIIDWHSSTILLILIPGLIIFILDIYWTLIYLPISIITGTFIYSFTSQGLTIVLLFLVCFALTFKEDIPQYGIKASIWLVPFLIALGFFFYTIMFGVSIEPLILQFGSGEGWINILILILTVLSGSLSSMKLKKERIKRKEIREFSELSR